MAKIHELSETLTNQIAAGEVIERPASVVKELVENSIDAGATRIRVDFVDAGLKQIVVQDNGSGIARDQVDLAFTRHATSKINNEHDLFKVATLGFRGEALASISAVAHVDITTAVNGEIGTKASFSGGVKKGQEDAASQTGTKIIVKDLFFNTPARLKYLRSHRTEMMKIVDIINRIALGYPQIAFSLSNNSKVILRTSGNGKLDQTVANVYGRHIAEKMISFENSDSDFKVTGLMSIPELTRSTRNYISILLNGRYIRNLHLNAAIMDGYGSKLPVRHYPIIIVEIKVDPLLVDVNVHPTKQEVRLSKEKELSRLITEAISEALLNKTEENNGFENFTNNRQDTLVDQLKFNLNKNVVNTQRIDLPEVNEQKDETQLTQPKKEKQYVDLSIPREDDRYIITRTWAENVKKQTLLTPFINKKIDSQIISHGDETLANNLPKLNYLAQTSTYIIAENAGDLFLVDKLAARRRLSFEKIYQSLTTEKLTQQGLLTPLVLEFGNLDFIQIKAKIDEIKKIGIYLEEFGQNSFIIRSYPTWIQKDAESTIRQILDDFLNRSHSSKENFYFQIAANQAKEQTTSLNLSASESSEILNKLRSCSDPYRDAEGKIVLVRMSKHDLEKMFKKDE